MSKSWQAYYVMKQFSIWHKSSTRQKNTSRHCAWHWTHPYLYRHCIQAYRTIGCVPPSVRNIEREPQVACLFPCWSTRWSGWKTDCFGIAPRLALWRPSTNTVSQSAWSLCACIWSASQSRCWGTFGVPGRWNGCPKMWTSCALRQSTQTVPLLWLLNPRSQLSSAWKSWSLAGISVVAHASSIWGAHGHHKHQTQPLLCRDTTRCTM